VASRFSLLALGGLKGEISLFLGTQKIRKKPTLLFKMSFWMEREWFETIPQK
jgi:hypothetical protein